MLYLVGANTTGAKPPSYDGEMGTLGLLQMYHSRGGKQAMNLTCNKLQRKYCDEWYSVLVPKGSLNNPQQVRTSSGALMYEDVTCTNGVCRTNGRSDAIVEYRAQSDHISFRCLGLPPLWVSLLPGGEKLCSSRAHLQRGCF